MAVDHATKIDKFARQTRGKLEAGKRPYNHLYSVCHQCGWVRRSTQNLFKIQTGLEAAGVFPEPILTARGLARDEVIRYRSTRPHNYRREMYEPPLNFASESAFEQFVLHNFDRIPAFAEFKSAERQYRLSGTGQAIDVLCRRRKTNGYVVIELKKAKATDPVGQLLSYMSQVDKRLAQPEGVGVEGMIVSPTRNTVLEEALAGSIKNYSVQWLTYRVSLRLD